ncbi:MAG: AAA family ATPase [Alphaproteobacteria bacterium]|nr:AAA family ATPase [Alphaproteobacteria bacterium]
MKFTWNQDFNIICGTPAIGKTTMGQKYENVIDLASSPYKYLDWDPKLAERNKGAWKHPNPNYIRDYIEAIIKHAKSYDLVLLTMSRGVRAALDERNIKYACAYSPPGAREIIRQRLLERGNGIDFVNREMSIFDERAEANEQLRDCLKIKIPPEQFLEQALMGYQTN